MGLVDLYKYKCSSVEISKIEEGERSRHSTYAFMVPVNRPFYEQMWLKTFGFVQQLNFNSGDFSGNG